MSFVIPIPAPHTNDSSNVPKETPRIPCSSPSWGTSNVDVMVEDEESMDIISQNKVTPCISD
jgi:hypothetical protein